MIMFGVARETAQRHRLGMWVTFSEVFCLKDSEGNVLESRGWCSGAEKALFLGIETVTVAPSNMFCFVLVRFPGALACCHVSCRTQQDCRPTHDVRSL